MMYLCQHKCSDESKKGMTVQLPRRLFTADEYERMITAGVFQEDDRLELIESKIIAMGPS